jgi:hypothetical protein
VADGGLVAVGAKHDLVHLQRLEAGLQGFFVVLLRIIEAGEGQQAQAFGRCRVVFPEQDFTMWYDCRTSESASAVRPICCSTCPR